MAVALPFDLGAFNDGTEDGSGEALSWRQDPSASFSDWTVHVKGKSSEAVGTAYHVHRTMLAIGPRRSQYFVRLTQGGASAMGDGIARASTLELEPSSIEAFPVYLDFVYTGALNATTATATALLYLADYLGCRALHDATVAFMQTDLRWEVAIQYLVEAELYSLEKVSAAALKLCAQHFGEFDQNLYTLRPTLFAKVVNCPDTVADTLLISRRVAEYCRGPHAAAINRELLELLTPASRMPEVCPSEALLMLRAACEHQLETGDSEGGVPLIERCVNACVSNWESVLLTKLHENTGTSQAASTSDTQRRESMTDEVDMERPPKRPRLSVVDSESQLSFEPLFSEVVPDSIQLRLLTSALVAASRDLAAQRTLLQESQADTLKMQAEKCAAERDRDAKQATLQRFVRVPKEASAGSFSVVSVPLADLPPGHVAREGFAINRVQREGLATRRLTRAVFYYRP